MTKQLVLFADANGQLTADTAATPNTLPLRDNAGNLVAAQVLGSEIKSSGVLTLPAKASSTTTVTLDASATFWPFDGTGGAFAATLPAAATCAGRTYLAIRTSSAGTITLTGHGSENINGANTYALSAQYAAAILYCDGTQWWVVGKV